ncbi:uncharacterized membrane protein at3g27390, partial [Phtheirospermum japonicum]
MGCMEKLVICSLSFNSWGARVDDRSAGDHSDCHVQEPVHAFQGWHWLFHDC